MVDRREDARLERLAAEIGELEALWRFQLALVFDRRLHGGDNTAQPRRSEIVTGSSQAVNASGPTPGRHQASSQRSSLPSYGVIEPSDVRCRRRLSSPIGRRRRYAASRRATGSSIRVRKAGRLERR